MVSSAYYATNKTTPMTACCFNIIYSNTLRQQAKMILLEFSQHEPLINKYPQSHSVKTYVPQILNTFISKRLFRTPRIKTKTK